MSKVLKVLVPPKVLENSQTTQYTANGVVACIEKCTATNFSSSAVTISVNLVTSGDSAGNQNIIAASRTLMPKQTWYFPEIVGHYLMPGGFISTLSGASSSVNFMVSGNESPPQ